MHDNPRGRDCWWGKAGVGFRGAQPELPYYPHAARYVKGNLGLFEVIRRVPRGPDTYIAERPRTGVAQVWPGGPLVCSGPRVRGVPHFSRGFREVGISAAGCAEH